MVTLVVAKSAGAYSFNLFCSGGDSFEVYFRPVACTAIIFVCFVCMP